MVIKICPDTNTIRRNNIKFEVCIGNNRVEILDHHSQSIEKIEVCFIDELQLLSTM